MNNKRLLVHYIRNTLISFLSIALLYLFISATFSIENFPSKTLALALFIFSVLFFAGWAVMLPAIYKNPKVLLVGIVSLTIIQMLLFLSFIATVAYTNSPTTVVFHVLYMFLGLILLQVVCIVKHLKATLT
jgi:hypothetical protein